ncbi:MAG: hypothetical protein GX963_00775 [Bacteroidales bacterium]|nr:hypothetical protein [Bacteroidales bacterium]
MFIRKKKNRSGITSVIVIDKNRGKFKELKTIGISSNPAEIENFYKKDQEWIKRRTSSLELDLFGERAQTERLLENIDQLLINGTELLLESIFDKIGFSAINDPIFKYLVLFRLSYSSSKRATVDYLKDYHDVEVDLSAVYRYLDTLKNSYKDKILQISISHTKQTLGGVVGICSMM